jgi:hypothetical protein
VSKQGTAEHPSSVRLPRPWVLIRDIGSFLGGWALIFMEVSRPEIRESVLVFAGLVIGVPGLAVGKTTIVEAITRRRSGTDS